MVSKSGFFGLRYLEDTVLNNNSLGRKLFCGSYSLKMVKNNSKKKNGHLWFCHCVLTSYQSKSPK